MKRICLDYAATTPVDPAVFNAMGPYFSKEFGNPSSLHFFGQVAMAAVDEAREKIAKAIGVPPADGFREILFAGSATEANNLALRGVVKIFGKSRAVAFRNQNISAPAAEISFPSARQPRLRSGTEPGAPAGYSSNQSALKQKFLPLRIIVSAIEHESILETCRDLEKDGVEVIYLPVGRDGAVELKKLKDSLNERTILVSVMYANNEIGTIQPIKEIVKTISEYRISKFESGINQKSKTQNSRLPLMHTDAVQAFQFLDCDVNKLGVDLMTLSAHKIYGPKGIGLLYAKSQIQNSPPKAEKFLSPIITGGNQECGLRSGTENVAAIVGFAKAVELAAANRSKESKRVEKLKDYFWQKIKKIAPKARLNNSASDCLPNIFNVYFPSRGSQDLLVKLDLVGIAVSSGAACSARSLKPSYVLAACGFSNERIKSSLRFSLGKFTTKAEINEALKRIRRVLK